MVYKCQIKVITVFVKVPEGNASPLMVPASPLLQSHVSTCTQSQGHLEDWARPPEDFLQESQCSKVPFTPVRFMLLGTCISHLERNLATWARSRQRGPGPEALISFAPISNSPWGIKPSFVIFGSSIENLVIHYLWFNIFFLHWTMEKPSMFLCSRVARLGPALWTSRCCSAWHPVGCLLTAHASKRGT